MKSILISVFTLIITLTFSQPNYAQYTNPPERAPAQSQEISEFNQRLDRIYGQADGDTLLQQIIFGSLEAIAAFKLGAFVTKVDTKKIVSINAQIEALKDTKPSPFFPNEVEMSDTERSTKIRKLQRELKTVEGGILRRMGRGTAKILIRGAQVFLILDVGTRIYVLNALKNKDPGFVPAYTLICSQVDCAYAIDEVIDNSNQAYIEARRTVEPRTAPPPAPTAPATPAAPTAPPTQTAPPQPEP